MMQYKVYWPKPPFHIQIKSETYATSKHFSKFGSELKGRVHKLESENHAILHPSAKFCFLFICPKVTNTYLLPDCKYLSSSPVFIPTVLQRNCIWIDTSTLK